MLAAVAAALTCWHTLQQQQQQQQMLSLHLMHSMWLRHCRCIERIQRNQRKKRTAPAAAPQARPPADQASQLPALFEASSLAGGGLFLQRAERAARRTGSSARARAARHAWWPQAEEGGAALSGGKCGFRRLVTGRETEFDGPGQCCELNIREGRPPCTPCHAGSSVY